MPLGLKKGKVSTTKCNVINIASAVIVCSIRKS